MTLFFIGCSFTAGDELDHPDLESWPALVSRAKQQPMINRAVSGGTNERILYETIKHMDKFNKCYIAWTSTARFTRYRTDNNHEVNFNPNLTHSLYGNQPEFLDYSKLHYKYWHNELFAFKTWLQQVILMQRYLETHNKKYLMVSTFENYVKKWTCPWQTFNNNVKSLLCFDLMDNHQLFAEHQEIQNLQNQINRKKFLGWGDICLKDLVNGSPSGPGGHPLTQGHQLIADYILTHDTN